MNPSLPSELAKAEPNKPNLWMMNAILSAVQEQIKLADTKGGYIASVSALFFGLLIARADKLALIAKGDRHFAFHAAICILIIYTLGTFVSLCHVIYSIMPRVNKQPGKSRTYFAHIRSGFIEDAEKYRLEVKSMTDSDWADDLSKQIVDVSRIATRKHQLIFRASIFALLSLVLWVMAMAFIALSL